MRYPGWKIEFTPPHEDIVDDSIFGKMTEVSVTKMPSEIPGWRTNRYPWFLLEKKDHYIIMHGVNARSVRHEAYVFARRRGWRVSTAMIDDSTLRIWRGPDRELKKQEAFK